MRSDDELLRVIHAPRGEYRTEAVELARAELAIRGIPLDRIPTGSEPLGAPLAGLPRIPVVTTIFRWLDTLDTLFLIGLVLFFIVAVGLSALTWVRGL